MPVGPPDAICNALLLFEGRSQATILLLRLFMEGHLELGEGASALVGSLALVHVLLAAAGGADPILEDLERGRKGPRGEQADKSEKAAPSGLHTNHRALQTHGD